MSRHSFYRSWPLYAGSLGLSALFIPHVRAGDFAQSVASYTPGTLTGSDAGFENSNAALGPVVDNTQYGSANPFNPPFESNHIVAVGPGGSIVLRLSSPVLASGAKLGVFTNVGLQDVSGDGSGLADGVPSTLSQDKLGNNMFPTAVLSVSATGLPGTFTQVGSGAMAFTIPTNYWQNAPPYSGYEPLPGTVAADQDEPFTGTLKDFASKTAQQDQSLLNGSAGGAWVDLSNLGDLPIQYVQFSVPSGTDERMVLDAVNLVPEPGCAALLGGGLMLLITRRTRR